jgi:dTDP-4-amino-4,6-dideoxygalactose transaminase
VADTGIILPLFHQMTELEHDYIIEALHDVSL